MITKRIALSETSKLFDPLGWVSPVFVSFKIFLQDLWIDGLDWDTSLNRELQETWESITENLNGISKIKIPRWLECNLTTEWSLHGFADVSKRAYSACVYFVPKIGKSLLICSKVRNAPAKTLLITHLELLGAHLLAKLIQYILSFFENKPHDIHF